MSISLSIQHTYQGIEIALLENAHVLASIQDDKKRASKNIIILIDELLRNYNFGIQHIDYIAVNQGPGPFTTLRVVIASVNGLSFATKKPLIGIDGLDALIQEYASIEYPVTIGLLNAFTNDVYFAIHDKNSIHVKKGCKNITALLLEIKEQIDQPIYLIGNGALLHEHEIKTVLGSRVIFAQPLPEHCSVALIGRMGYVDWQKQHNLSFQLFPLYLKSM